MDNISYIASLILSGKVVIFPTETLYALSGLASDEEVVKKIYYLKQREVSKPFSIFVKDVEAAAAIAEISPLEEKIMARFMPGPLTIILRRKVGESILAKNINIQNNTIAVRIPDHIVALPILQKVNKPIIATSCNLSGSANLLSQSDVCREFKGKVDYIFEEKEFLLPNNCLNIASTIIMVENGELKLIRKGAIEIEDIRHYIDTVM